MKKLILSLPALFLLTCLTAQQQPKVIFKEEFNGSLGTFTTGKGTPRGAVWQWAPKGKADTVIVSGKKYAASFFTGAPAIGSPTAANGAAQFNSDAYDNGGDPRGFGNGPFPSPQTDTLTSPLIDCSLYNQVTLVFYQFIRTSFDNYSVVEVSGDGGATWTEYPVNQRELSNEINGIKPTLPAAPFEHEVVLDISEVAAKSSRVRVRFRWNEGDYYFWLIDDVMLIESPDNNLAISDFIYPLSSFATPASQIGTDTFGFAAFISNHGKKAASNVVVKASVLSLANNQIKEHFVDSVQIDQLPAGYLDSVIIFPELYAPELPAGGYFVVYEVSAENQEDYYPVDNTDGQSFVVTDKIFAKEDGFLYDDAETPVGFTFNGDYQIGNYFRLSPLAGPGFVATSVTLAAGRPGSAGSIGGNVANILVYKVKDRVTENFENFNVESTASGTPEDDLDLVGLGSLVFPNNYSPFDDASAPVEDFEAIGSPVNLAPGGRYFIVAEYQGNNNKIIHLVSDDIVYAPNALASVLYFNDQWTGLGRGAQAILRMEIQFTNARDEIPLPDHAVRIFPNPVGETLNVELDLEKSGEALAVIAGIDGKIYKMQSFRQVQSRERLQFDVSNYAPGTYLFRLGTKEGTKTLKFVVSR